MFQCPLNGFRFNALRFHINGKLFLVDGQTLEVSIGFLFDDASINLLPMISGYRNRFHMFIR